MGKFLNKVDAKVKEFVSAIDKIREHFYRYELADVLNGLKDLVIPHKAGQEALRELLKKFPTDVYSEANGWNTAQVPLEEQTTLFRAIEHTLNIISGEAVVQQLPVTIGLSVQDLKDQIITAEHPNFADALKIIYEELCLIEPKEDAMLDIAKVKQAVVNKEYYLKLRPEVYVDVLGGKWQGVANFAF